MPNNSKLRRERKALAKEMRQYEASTYKPERYPKVVGNAPKVTMALRARRKQEREAAKQERLETVRRQGMLEAA